MYRLITSAVFITLSTNYPLTYATQPVGSSAAIFANPVTFPNTPYPYNPNINPSNPYYKNQYSNQYNRVGGPVTPILTYSSENSGDGTYAFSFSTADGKQAQENGYLKDAYIDNAGETQGTQVVQGSFAYVSPEGTPVQVNYVADENGFRPSGTYIAANGKFSALPLPAIIDAKNRPIVDPFFNRYNPYNPYGHYNYNSRPYDHRYPYNTPRYNPIYNKYNQILGVSHNRFEKLHNKLQ